MAERVDDASSLGLTQEQLESLQAVEPKSVPVDWLGNPIKNEGETESILDKAECALKRAASTIFTLSGSNEPEEGVETLDLNTRVLQYIHALFSDSKASHLLPIERTWLLYDRQLQENSAPQKFRHFSKEALRCTIPPNFVMYDSKTMRLRKGDEFFSPERQFGKVCLILPASSKPLHVSFYSGQYSSYSYAEAEQKLYIHAKKVEHIALLDSRARPRLLSRYAAHAANQTALLETKGEKAKDALDLSQQTTVKVVTEHRRKSCLPGNLSPKSRGNIRHAGE
jgi:hypothetical protein